jgi:hypothetical protein
MGQPRMFEISAQHQSPLFDGAFNVSAKACDSNFATQIKLTQTDASVEPGPSPD